MTTRLATLLMTAMIAVLAATPGQSGEAPLLSDRGTPGETMATAHLADAWTAFKAHHLEGGRVVDDGNGGVSHSEGQGYAMLVAAKVGDRETFDALWAWTDRELFVRKDGLAAWLWSPEAGGVTDSNNATDGDLLIAWALTEAGWRWQERRYLDRAAAISVAIFDHAVVDSVYGPLLMPGVEGFGPDARPDGPVVNLSYWVFPAMERLEPLVPELNWRGLRETGKGLIAASAFGPLRLPSDWVALGSGEPVPASGYDAVFGYNAIRIPLYLVWSEVEETDTSDLRRFTRMWDADDDFGPFVIDVETGSPGADLTDAGYRLTASVIDCGVLRTPIPDGLMAGTDQLYYPSVLTMLALLTIEEAGLPC